MQNNTNPANIVLDYFQHNSPETNAIGRYFWSAQPGVPFQQVVSFFYYEDYTISDSVIDTTTGSTMNTGMMKAKRNTLIAPKFSNIPYRVRSSQPIYDPSTGKDIYTADLMLYGKPYTLPNRFNRYLGNETSTEDFYGIKGAAGGLIGQQVNHLAPPVDAEELNSYKSFGRYNSTKPVLHRTSCVDTCSYWRSQSEYSSRRIREYIYMSFGDSMWEDKDGNEVILKAKDNIKMVPIIMNNRWRRFSPEKANKEIDAEHPKASPEERKKLMREKMDEHNDKLFFIDPSFIKSYNAIYKDELTRRENVQRSLEIEKEKAKYSDILGDQELIELARKIKSGELKVPKSRKKSSTNSKKPATKSKK